MPGTWSSQSDSLASLAAEGTEGRTEQGRLAAEPACLLFKTTSDDVSDVSIHINTIHSQNQGLTGDAYTAITPPSDGRVVRSGSGQTRFRNSSPALQLDAELWQEAGSKRVPSFQSGILVLQ